MYVGYLHTPNLFASMCNQNATIELIWYEEEDGNLLLS